MARTQQLGAKEMPLFQALPVKDREAVVMRCEGSTYKEIAQHTNKSELTVRAWFISGGRLEAAKLEYLEVTAESHLREAQQMAKLASQLAIATMIELTREGVNAEVRLGAARALANKYIPDRQITVNKSGDRDDLPSDLEDRGNVILGYQPTGYGNTDKPEPVPNEPRESEGAHQGAGDTGDQGLPTEIL